MSINLSLLVATERSYTTQKPYEIYMFTLYKGTGEKTSFLKFSTVWFYKHWSCIMCNNIL